MNFISEMYISELHVLVRPEINSFKDLEGKKVSFHTAGAGSSVTGPILFQRLGVKVEPVYINNAIAYEKMKTGEIAALIHNGGKPQRPLHQEQERHGFKFLAVPFDKFDDYYVPSVFTARGLSGLRQARREGRDDRRAGGAGRLQLAARERPLPARAALHRVLLRPLRELPQPPYHPKWKSINLAAKVPGWTRYWVAEEKLKQMAAAKARRSAPVDTAAGPPAGGARAPNDAAEQERLFQQFLEWSKTQGKQ